jgi:hypothetical protein
LDSPNSSLLPYDSIMDESPYVNLKKTANFVDVVLSDVFPFCSLLYLVQYSAAKTKKMFALFPLHLSDGLYYSPGTRFIHAMLHSI